MGLNGVVSGYPTSINFPRVEGLSTEPRDRDVTEYIMNHIIRDMNEWTEKT